MHFSPLLLFTTLVSLATAHDGEHHDTTTSVDPLLTDVPTLTTETHLASHTSDLTLSLPETTITRSSFTNATTTVGGGFSNSTTSRAPTTTVEETTLITTTASEAATDAPASTSSRAPTSSNAAAGRGIAGGNSQFGLAVLGVAVAAGFGI